MIFSGGEMKKLVVALALALSAYADVVLFECGGNDQVYLNGFEGIGEVHFDGQLEAGEMKPSSGSFAVVLRDAGNEGKLSSVVSVNLEGSVKSISGMSREDVTYAEFVADVEGQKFHVGLLLDFAKNLSSKINDRATGRSYQANCQTTSVFNN